MTSPECRQPDFSHPPTKKLAIAAVSGIGMSMTSVTLAMTGVIPPEASAAIAVGGIYGPTLTVGAIEIIKKTRFYRKQIR